MSQIIFHIDVNSAFLSWTAVEQLKNGFEQDIREIPAIIGGDQKARHGIVLAKSVSAKKYGIVTGEPIVNALRKCPEIQMFPPNHRMYSEYSARLMGFLKNYTPDIEQVSVDECYMDFTGIAHKFSSPFAAAKEIKDAVYKTFGFTVNIGISSNRLLAKMASDFEKPNKVHTLWPEEIQVKMWPLPVRDLFFVGKASEKKLQSLGIRTIGELAKADVNLLKTVLKKHGEVIWNFANGRDAAKLEAEPVDNKGYGNSTTLSFDVTDAQTAKSVLLSLTETVGIRLRRDHARIEVVSVTVRYNDFSENSHQMALKAATNITNEIYDVACKLFDELWDGNPIRLLGVSTSKATKQETGRQLSLFDNTDYEKLEKLDKALDSIREKYGMDAIQRASVLNKKESGKTH